MKATARAAWAGPGTWGYLLVGKFPHVKVQKGGSTDSENFTALVSGPTTTLHPVTRVEGPGARTTG